MLRVNQHLMTPLGPGKVVGFERFTPEGQQAPDSLTDRPDDICRVQVQLDTPENWVCHATSKTHPYFFRSQLNDYKD